MCKIVFFLFLFLEACRLGEEASLFKMKNLHLFILFHVPSTELAHGAHTHTHTRQKHTKPEAEFMV